ncbi:MAG TPA: hypothetical protein VF958_14070 [Thermoanaerobaculia bacterium]
MTYLRKRTVLSCLACAYSTTLLAQSPRIPVTNWTVPAYRGAVAGGVSPMSDISPGVGFVAVTPCRLVDTRGGEPFTGAYGPPALVAHATRDFDLNSAPHCPGIPAGVDAYSLNLGAILPAADGFLSAWPTGSAMPTVSAVNYLAGEVIANAEVVPTGTGGSISLTANTNTDVYIDINGYFTDSYNDGVPFRAIGNVPGGPSPGSGVVLAWNTNTTNSYSNGGAFFSEACHTGSAGVVGETLSSGAPGCGPVIGVWGISENDFDASTGVYGVQWAPTGIVVGATNSSSNDSAGVWGYAGGLAPGRNYGITGESNSVVNGAAGVLGIDVNGMTVSPSGPGGTIGVRGDSRFSTGVLGLSEDHDAGQRAVTGQLLNFGNGTPIASGHLGYDAGMNNYAVFAAGDYGGTGAKYFVEPHPTDASKVIRYIALEGPEAGTYFRGKGRFQNGVATIAVPEDFRLVTDPDSLSVVATPIGDMAVIAVARVGLDRIVLRSSRNVEFFYLVNGVRKTHKDLAPIVAGNEYAPASADARMPPSLTDGQRQMLVSNGTYNADGSVNLETARRLGWDRIWEERARPRPEPARAKSLPGLADR